MQDGEADVTRIGTLVGSLRRNSFSRALADALQPLCAQSVEIVALPSVGTLPHFDQDLLDEGVPHPVEAVATALRSLDGLLIVTPEYNWSIPGTLKNALDWLSRLKPMPLAGMPAMIVTSSPGLLGGARAHSPIRDILHSLDCRLLARPEIQIARVASKIDLEANRITDQATTDFLTERLTAFERFVGSQERRDGAVVDGGAQSSGHGDPKPGSRM